MLEKNYVRKSSKVLPSNIVSSEQLREFQLSTLNLLSEALKHSFGPFGSNTTIYSSNTFTKYTKDGHTILSKIALQDNIERSVKSDIETITQNIVKLVGDGTTSAVMLSNYIFSWLLKFESECTLSPYLIIKEFKKCVDMIKEEIESNTQEFTSEKAYSIAMISTNGNEKIAKNIKDIYDEFGNDVFVDVAASITEEDYIKIYDGLTLEAGYGDPCFINDLKKKSCVIREPHIFAFEDPIDTTEMECLFRAIIEKNIMEAFKTNDISRLQPTVIIAPKISRDMSSYVDQVINFMNSCTRPDQKPPLLFITNIYNMQQYMDVARLCGCGTIQKYIDTKLYEEHVKQGLAPTPETITNFAGTADIVESDLSKTKFVNPAYMFEVNEEGERVHTEQYQSLLTSLESELAKAYENGENNNVTGNLRRRINSLKANMVEYLVGGMSMSDRDSIRDLVEDAVLNCRSAARYGVGYGANFEGLRAAKSLLEKETSETSKKFLQVIVDAYLDLVFCLYKTAFIDATDKVNESLEAGKPIDLHTGKPSDIVLCTIKSDVVILESIAKIISLMFTSNQFLCETIVNNKYLVL